MTAAIIIEFKPAQIDLSAYLLSGDFRKYVFSYRTAAVQSRFDVRVRVFQFVHKKKLDPRVFHTTMKPRDRWGACERRMRCRRKANTRRFWNVW